MAVRLLVAATVAAGAVALVAAATVVGAFVWHRRTTRRVELLVERSHLHPHAASTRGSQDGTDGLPPPVARYFAFALPVGARRVRVARLRWAGEMRTRIGDAWSPFTADQWFTVSPPGFVWDAKLRMLPSIAMRVRDGYVAGEGSMLGRLAGLVTVVGEGGTREMASSALARWLGEAAWFPTALLPGDGVTWEALDDGAARATVTDGATRTSADFHFAATGELTRMTTMRFRDVHGTGVLTPFEGRYAHYVRREGMMVPSSAEVAWLLPEGRFAYWRGRPTAVAYEWDGLTDPISTAPNVRRICRWHRGTRVPSSDP